MNNKKKLVKLLDEGFVKIGHRLIRMDKIVGISPEEAVKTSEAAGIIVEIDTGSSIHIKELKYPKFMSQLVEAREEIEKEIAEKLKVPEELLSSVYLGDPNIKKTLSSKMHSPLEPDIVEERDRVIEHTAPKVIPLASTPKLCNTEIIIDNMDLSSASGNLSIFEGEIIVNRESILIKDSGGRMLGQGHEAGGGTIHGTNVSGIINCNGKYRLVFKEYNGDKAFISYYVGRK